MDSYAQNAVIGRLSDVKKQYKQESDKLNKLVSAAKQIYGTDDVDKISDLLLSDDRLYEDEAFKRGVDVSVIKQEKILERREQALNERELAQQHENEFIELDKKWREEAEGLMPVYPNFDFDAVMSDEEKGAEMLDFLMQGISLKKRMKLRI